MRRRFEIFRDEGGGGGYQGIREEGKKFIKTKLSFHFFNQKFFFLSLSPPSKETYRDFLINDGGLLRA